MWDDNLVSIFLFHIAFCEIYEACLCSRAANINICGNVIRENNFPVECQFVVFNLFMKSYELFS